MPGTVFHEFDHAPGKPHDVEKLFGKGEIGSIIIAADIINFPRCSLFYDGHYRPAVILDMNPVAHILALAVYGKLFLLHGLSDEKRNYLFGKLKWPVIVARASDHHREAIGIEKRKAKEVGRSLAGGIRRAGSHGIALA